MIPVIADFDNPATMVEGAACRLSGVDFPFIGFIKDIKYLKEAINGSCQHIFKFQPVD